MPSPRRSAPAAEAHLAHRQGGAVAEVSGVAAARRDVAAEGCSAAAAGPDLRDAPAAAAEVGGFAVEFVAGPLAFAGELAVLLLSCALPVLALCGGHALTILVVGVIAAYIFDFTNQRALCVAAVWLTAAAALCGIALENAALIWSSSLSLFICLNAAMYLGIAALFATVQFRWFQLSSPYFAVAAERALRAVAPVVCLPLLFSTTVSVAGVNAAPLVLAAILVVCQRRFFSPRRSSFKRPLAVAPGGADRVGGAPEAAAFALLCLVLPLGVHWAVTHRESWSLSQLTQAAALVGAPLLGLWAQPRQTLWFLYSRPHSDAPGDACGVERVRAAVLLLSYAAVLHCFLYRVVVGSYGHMLTGVSPPWNVALIYVCAAAVSAVALCAVQLSGMSISSHGGMVVTRWVAVLLLSILAAVSFALVAGVPRVIMPFPAVAAATLSSFCLDPRNMNNFLFFAACSVVMLMWWMFKSFSFLIRVHLPVLCGTQEISLVQLSTYIVLLYLVQCIVFANSLQPGTAPLAPLLAGHACGLAAIEHVLYSQPEGLYPAACTVFTSALGVQMCRRLMLSGRLSRQWGAAVVGVYVGKLYTFAATATAPLDQLPDSTAARSWQGGELVCLAVAASAASGIAAHFALSKRQGSRRYVAGSWGLARAYAVNAALVAALSRQNVVLAVLEVATGNAAPQGGRLFGLATVYAGVLMLPLLWYLPPSQAGFRRITAGTIFVGAVITLLDPALEGPSTGASEFEYQPPAAASLAAIAVVAIVTATLLNIITLPDRLPARLVFWGAVAALSGTTFSVLFVPFPGWVLTLLVSLMLALLALVVDTCHFSEAAQSEDSSTVVGMYTALLVCCLCALLYAQRGYPEGLDEVMKWEVGQQRQMAILSLNAGINILIAALVKMKLVDAPVFVPRSIARSDAIRGGMGGASHFGLMCNICTFQGYVSLLVLQGSVGGSGPGQLVVIAGLLLLLHDDGWMLVGVGDPDRLTRLVPPLLAAAGTLLWQLCRSELPALWGRRAAGPVQVGLQVAVVLLAAGLVCHAALQLTRDAAARRRGSSSGARYGVCWGSVLLALAWLPSARWLAGLGVLASAVLAYADKLWFRRLAQATE
eukprot:TRINITY_DN20122_c0_g1_i1.p1 TRINITY_DN20122_c0_g1~~TRINITY_DN20122_c0_g1_i1.p1  ORF type:complete len:1127 (+),score=407.21 TRINITY_DN20122_c0_g1_i1:69-3383(+)